MAMVKRDMGLQMTLTELPAWGHRGRVLMPDDNDRVRMSLHFPVSRIRSFRMVFNGDISENSYA